QLEHAFERGTPTPRLLSPRYGFGQQPLQPFLEMGRTPEETRRLQVPRIDDHVEQGGLVRAMPAYVPAGEVRDEIERKSPASLHRALEKLQLQHAPHRRLGAIHPLPRGDFGQAERRESGSQMGRYDRVALACAK